MAVFTAPQPQYIEVGQTVAAAALAEAGYKASYNPAKTYNRKAGNAKAKAEPPVVKSGEGHPDLIGRQYKDLTKAEYTKNFQWRKDNKCCTECGSSAHKFRKCTLREKKIRKVSFRPLSVVDSGRGNEMLIRSFQAVSSKEYNFHMLPPVVQHPNLPLMRIPRELRDLILELVVNEYRGINDVDQDFTVQTDRKFLPGIFRVSYQLSRESLEVLMRTNNFILRSGRAMKYFQRFIKDHQMEEFVRSLEFPSFHWFNPGQAYPANRHGPGGVYSMVSGDVELMQLCTNLQKVRISLDVAYTVNGDAHAYSVQNFIKRYNLEQIVNCTRLIELVLELTDRHGYAFGLQPGQNVWSNGEDLAQLFRDRMAARVESEVKAEFEASKEAAMMKAVEEKREYKADEVKEQAALTVAITAAQTTSVRTVQITRI